MSKKILLLVLILAIATCQKTLTSTTIPIKDLCNPRLMKSLANPNSTIPDNQALKRLYHTIKLASDPETVLNDLSLYSPRFTGLVLNHIQSVHLNKKAVMSLSPEVRTKCLDGFTKKSCSQICNTDIIATPQITDPWDVDLCDPENWFVKGDYEIFANQQQAEFDRYYDDLLKTYYRADGTYIYSDEELNCPSEAKNGVQQDMCFEDFWQMIFQQYYEYKDEGLVIQKSALSTEMPKINLFTLVDNLRRLLNSKFGLGVFAEKSLRCVRGDYLYRQSL